MLLPFVLRRSGGEPIDFEDPDEDAVFGRGKIEDFTWKGYLDFTTCTECGRCQSQCPAWNTEKPLSPKLLIMDEPSEGLAPLVVEHLNEQIARLLSGGVVTNANAALESARAPADTLPGLDAAVSWQVDGTNASRMMAIRANGTPTFRSVPMKPTKVAKMMSGAGMIPESASPSRNWPSLTQPRPTASPRTNGMAV